MNEPRLTQSAPITGFPSDVASGSNAAAVSTYTAFGDGWAHVVFDVCWSYSGTPTGGNLQIADGSDVIFDIDITAGGPGQVTFSRPKQGTPNRGMTVTLAAGGSGVVGKLTVNHALRDNIPLDGLDFLFVDNSGLFVAID